MAAWPKGMEVLFFWYFTAGVEQGFVFEEKHWVVPPRKAVLNRPLASYGLDGTATLKPGRCVKIG